VNTIANVVDCHSSLLFDGRCDRFTPCSHDFDLEFVSMSM